MSIPCVCCVWHVTPVSLENPSSRARLQLPTSPHLTFPPPGPSHLSTAPLSPTTLHPRPSMQVLRQIQLPGPGIPRSYYLIASFPFWWCFEAYWPTRIACVSSIPHALGALMIFRAKIESDFNAVKVSKSLVQANEALTRAKDTTKDLEVPGWTAANACLWLPTSSGSSYHTFIGQC